MSEFKQKTVISIKWNLIGNTSQQLISIITISILAHLLSPNEFGLLAIVTVLTGFATIYSELGFGAALIQKRDVTQVHLSSVFWLNIFVGISLTGLFMALSPLIADFYNQSILLSITFVISLVLAIDSLNIVQRVQYMKHLDFRFLTIIGFVSGLTGSIVSIVAALKGLGVWSLVIQRLTSSLVTTAMIWSMSNWRPSITFQLNALRDLWSFSLYYIGTQTLTYWTRNFDKLLIGGVLGSASLGAYNIAYSILLFPIRNVSQVISKVLFPALSTIQNEKERVKKIYLQVSSTIALVTFPTMLGLFALSEEFILTILGEKWIDTIDILNIFCFLGILQSVVALVGILYRSQGRTNLEFKVSLILRFNVIICIVIGINWGMLGVAIGYGAASLINAGPNIYFAGNLVGITILEWLKNLGGIFICSVAMAGTVVLSKQAFPVDWPEYTVLISGVCIGIVVYGGLLQLFRIEAYREAIILLKEHFIKFQPADH